jgi:hypothetical protein
MIFPVDGGRADHLLIRCVAIAVPMRPLPPRITTFLFEDVTADNADNADTVPTASSSNAALPWQFLHKFIVVTSLLLWQIGLPRDRRRHFGTVGTHVGNGSKYGAFSSLSQPTAHSTSPQQ